MKDFGLLYFVEGYGEEKKQNSLLKNIFSWLGNPFGKNKIELKAEKLVIYDGRSVHIIEIPYTLESLKNISPKNLKNLEKALYYFIESNDLECCIYPADTGLDFSSPLLVKSRFSGELIYRALIKKILLCLCNASPQKLIEPEIVVISGESDLEAAAVIEILASQAKYLAAAVSNKDSFSGTIERIYEETGLSVILTENIAASLKTADIVINFSKTYAKERKFRLKPGTILINYGSVNLFALSEKNMVINGIEVSLKNIPDKMIFKLQKYYNRLEFLEAAIILKLGRHGGMPGWPDKTLINSIEKELEKSGSSITGFLGLHSKIKCKDLAKIMPKKG
jgi:hypothetical protein